MKDTDFPKAKVFCAVPGIGFPHSIPIPVTSILYLKEDLKMGYEITVFDLTEPRSVAFTEYSYPKGGMK